MKSIRSGGHFTCLLLRQNEVVSGFDISFSIASSIACLVLDIVMNTQVDCSSKSCVCVCVFNWHVTVKSYTSVKLRGQ